MIKTADLYPVWRDYPERQCATCRGRTEGVAFDKAGKDLCLSCKSRGAGS